MKMSIEDFKKMMIEKHGRPVIFRFKLDESWDDYFDEENGVCDELIVEDMFDGFKKDGIKKIELIKSKDIPKYQNPVTTEHNIKELQEILVQTCIDYIKKNNLNDVDEINFNVDGLTNNAIEYGEWTPSMDSYIKVIGLQDETHKKKDDTEETFMVRKFIGEYM